MAVFGSLNALAGVHKISLRHVKSHRGIAGNELADQAAKSAAGFTNNKTTDIEPVTGKQKYGFKESKLRVENWV